MNTIGDRLKEIRQNANKSQKNFAELLEVPLSTYKTYEQNKASIPHVFFIKLNKVFSEYSMDWLLLGNGSKLSPTHIISLYIEAIFKVKPKIEDILIRLFSNFIAKEINYEKLDNIDYEKNCMFLEKKWNIDLYESYRKNEIPYLSLLKICTIERISFEWILFGTNEYIINEKYQNIIDLLPYTSEKFLEILKQKLIEFKKEQEEFFKIN